MIVQKTERLNKIILGITITAAAITLVNLGLSLGARIYIWKKLGNHSNEAGSLGVIGGSDGPTAIFITGPTSSNSITLTFGLLSIIGIVYLILVKKYRNKRQGSDGV